MFEAAAAKSHPHRAACRLARPTRFELATFAYKGHDATLRLRSRAMRRDAPRSAGGRRRRVMWGRHIATLVIMLTACIGTSAEAQSPAATGTKKFEVVETTIADIQSAIRARQLTAT